MIVEIWNLTNASMHPSFRRSEGLKFRWTFILHNIHTITIYNYTKILTTSKGARLLRFFVRIRFRRLLLMLRNLNIILIFLLNIRIFVNVIFQAIKIELKIAMRKKHIIPTRKVNMYSNRLVLTKLLKYMLTFLVGMAFSS